MKKIKVLMVMGSTQRAGAETYVMNVIRSIDREKFQIDIAVRKGKRGEYDTEILELGCSIFDLPSYKITNIIGYKKKWSEFFRLRIINQRGEDNNQISIRYLAEHSEVEGSILAEPRLEDLYLWLFPQEDVEREEK